MEKVPVLCLFFVLSISVACARVENVLSLNADPPLANGLSWTFYKSTCPKLESIVKKRIEFYLEEDITQAAGLLRLHFHDCFVQPAGRASKKPLQIYRCGQKAFEIINDIKERVDKACGVIVSCADITALAARDSVSRAGGPDYKVPLGRRDSLTFATTNVTLANLPSPQSNTSVLITAFAAKGLDVTDLVALSGGHTIGIGHCTSFTERFYPVQDSTLDKSFAKNLKVTCPTTNTTNTTALDIRTPNIFDNKYYLDLMNRQGFFTSDQELYTDSRTKQIVKDFAVNQDLFFQKFALAMAKMGQLNVVTGSNGEIRSNCSAPNPTSSITTLFEDVIDLTAFI